MCVKALNKNERNKNVLQLPLTLSFESTTNNNNVYIKKNFIPNQQ